MLNVAAQNQLVAYFERIRETVEFQSVTRLFLSFFFFCDRFSPFFFCKRKDFCAAPLPLKNSRSL